MAELLSMIGAGLILLASVSMSGRKLFFGKTKNEKSEFEPSKSAKNKKKTDSS